MEQTVLPHLSAWLRKYYFAAASQSMPATCGYDNTPWSLALTIVYYEYVPFLNLHSVFWNAQLLWVLLAEEPK